MATAGEIGEPEPRVMARASVSRLYSELNQALAYRALQHSLASRFECCRQAIAEAEV